MKENYFYRLVIFCIIYVELKLSQIQMYDKTTAWIILKTCRFKNDSIAKVKVLGNGNQAKGSENIPISLNVIDFHKYDCLLPIP